MRFNAKKCQIMSITRGKSHPTHLYTLCGHVLSSVQEAKCLGITLTDELSWSSHVCSIHNRANSILGFLRRNLPRCPARLKETAYITLVRSTLEYAAPVWDLIWPGIVTYWRKDSGDQRGLSKGINQSINQSNTTISNAP